MAFSASWVNIFRTFNVCNLEFNNFFRKLLFWKMEALGWTPRPPLFPRKQSFRTISASFCFTEKPRPPPSGCCPKNYSRHCCPSAGDNEPVKPCEIQPKGPVNTTSPIPPRFNQLTACVHTWRTQACAGGFYLHDGKIKACPRGMHVFVKFLVLSGQIRHLYKNIFLH